MQTPREPESPQVAKASGRAERFVDALREAEARGEPDLLVPLFADDAELRSLMHEAPRRGIEGARRFWTEYLLSFHELRSRFTRVRDAGDLVVLEWTTEATTRAGDELRYDGVSLLEYAGDRIRDFRTYYDSAALGGHARPARHAH